MHGDYLAVDFLDVDLIFDDEGLRVDIPPVVPLVLYEVADQLFESDPQVRLHPLRYVFHVEKSLLHVLLAPASHCVERFGHLCIYNEL